MQRMNSCAGFCLGTSDTQKSITLTIKRKQSQTNCKLTAFLEASGTGAAGQATNLKSKARERQHGACSLGSDKEEPKSPRAGSLKRSKVD